MHNSLVDETAATSSGNRDKYAPLKIKRGQIETFDPSLLGRAYQLMKESGHDMSGYLFDGRPVSEIKLNINPVQSKDASRENRPPVAGRAVPDGLKLRAP